LTVVTKSILRAASTTKRLEWDDPRPSLIFESAEGKTIAVSTEAVTLFGRVLGSHLWAAYGFM
jgi:hypothetical protein